MQQNESSIFAQAVSMVAEREKQQHDAYQEQCYAKTIRSLDTDSGYQNHAHNNNGLTPISRLFGLPQEPRSLAKIEASYLAPFPKCGSYCFWGVASPILPRG
jgi:hypothetical protein